MNRTPGWFICPNSFQVCFTLLHINDLLLLITPYRIVLILEEIWVHTLDHIVTEAKNKSINLQIEQRTRLIEILIFFSIKVVIVLFINGFFCCGVVTIRNMRMLRRT